jgi:transposase-like protein
MIQISNKMAEDAVRFLTEGAASITGASVVEKNRKRVMRKLAKMIQRRLDKRGNSVDGI